MHVVHQYSLTVRKKNFDSVAPVVSLFQNFSQFSFYLAFIILFRYIFQLFLISLVYLFPFVLVFFFGLDLNSFETCTCRQRLHALRLRFSAWTNNPHTMRMWVRIHHGAKEKIARRHLGVMTWAWPGPLRMSEVKGRNTCYEGGFFSEDSLLFGSPVSFFILFILHVGKG